MRIPKANMIIEFWNFLLEFAFPLMIFLKFIIPCYDLSILVSQNQNLLLNKSIITNVDLQLISTQAFDYDKGTLLSIKKCPTVISFSDLKRFSSFLSKILSIVCPLNTSETINGDLGKENKYDSFKKINLNWLKRESRKT